MPAFFFAPTTDAIAISAVKRHCFFMWYLLFKAFVSGVIIAIVSEVSKRQPGFGALIASLPLISVMGMIWLWTDKPDAENMAHHSLATFWYVLPSLPMFLLIPALLNRGWPFWGSLGAGCLMTIVLYASMVWITARMGLDL